MTRAVLRGTALKWTDEQSAIIAHDGDTHARVLAGPGTGKSTTVVALARRLAAEKGEGAVRVATFTRAATAELAEKALAEELDVPVKTVHSFALSILRANPQWQRLPATLRIPDDWEFDNLIHEDLRARLTERWSGIRKSQVKRLERELAARWEALDDRVMTEDVDPELRDAYVARWQEQRTVFGYVLFAEMPWYALELVEDHTDADLLGTRVLIVDEYQDLNRCEIELLQALAGLGVTVIAVGDDDQSIYSWRMAAPEGIRNFDSDFPQSVVYPLSISHRCGTSILEAAGRLIRTAPDRAIDRREPRPSEANPAGAFAYLRFKSAQREREALTEILTRLNAQHGVSYDNIAVLLRSDYQRRWSTPIKEVFDGAGIPYTDVESALEPLNEDASRKLIAIARLAVDCNDSLSWWTIVHLTSGISGDFVRQVADDARKNGKRFEERLLRIRDKPLPDATAASHNKTIGLIEEIQAILTELDIERVPESEHSWATWLLDVAELLSLDLSDDFAELLVRVGAEVPTTEGLMGLMASLEPTARDQALEAGGVRIMTIARSKGLTVDAAITVGVEDELFPLPFSDDPEEDRRLLYVAMTRARRASIFTMARTRNDGTSHSGSGNAVWSRSRCTYLSAAGINPDDGETFLRSLILE